MAEERFKPLVQLRRATDFCESFVAAGGQDSDFTMFCDNHLALRLAIEHVRNWAFELIWPHLERWKYWKHAFKIGHIPPTLERWEKEVKFGEAVDPSRVTTPHHIRTDTGRSIFSALINSDSSRQYVIVCRIVVKRSKPTLYYVDLWDARFRHQGGEIPIAQNTNLIDLTSAIDEVLRQVK